MTALLLIVTTAAVLLFVVMALAAAASPRRGRSARLFAAAAALVVLYAAALFGVAAASRPRTLAAGAWRCFDDWCITEAAEAATPAGRTVTLVVRNGGRGRTQRPDAPQVFFEPAGHPPIRLVVPGLNQQLVAGQTATLTCPLASRAPGRLVVTEGGWPSRLVIGDENSPGHARSGWDL